MFQFLTDATDRQRYLRNLRSALRVGGYFVLAVFSDEGGLTYTGFDAERYDIESLAATIGHDFHLIETLTEDHRTPFVIRQKFLYAMFRHIPE